MKLVTMQIIAVAEKKRITGVQDDNPIVLLSKRDESKFKIFSGGKRRHFVDRIKGERMNT